MNLFNKRYILHEKLGAGGMGTVYRATDRLTGQDVALKMVTLRQADGSSMDSKDSGAIRLSLAREFQTLAALRHPHIIGVMDYGFDDEQNPYYTMTLLNHPQTIFEATRTLSDADCANLLIQLLQALAYLHRHGIVHRDLKPTNVYVVEGQVRVLDFGLAKPMDQSEGIVGTLAYMAPEVLKGHPATQASDLYSVGIIAYEIFTGKHPYRTSSSPRTLIVDIMSTEPDWTPLTYDVDTMILDQVPSGLPETLPKFTTDTLPNILLSATIQKLLAKNPTERYDNVEEVIQDLQIAFNQPISEESSAIRESFIQAAVFVGRDTELALLENSQRQAQNGIGSAWLVGGESGVGKSRLLDELRIRAMVNGALVLHGQAVAGGGLAYHLWRNPLRRLVLASDITELEASILSTIIPDMNDLVDRAIAPAPPLPEAEAKQRLIGTIMGLFLRNPFPTVLILEDLHWAGESLTILKRLVSMIDICPLLMVASYRDDEAPTLSDQLADMHLIKLERLDPKTIADLSASMIGAAGREPHVVEFLQQHTEGNVFFLVEVVRVLAEEAGRLQDVGRVTLPEHIVAGGIQMVVERRLARVPEWAKPALRLAAVAGRELDLAILQNAFENADIPLDLDAWLLACGEAAVLEVRDTLWRFTHDKLREGVLTSLSEAEQAKLHEQIATSIEAVYADHELQAFIQVEHWQKAGNHDKERYYARLAGLKSLESSNPTIAREYFERALALLPTDDMEHQQIVLNLGIAHERVSNFAEAKHYYTLSLAFAEKLHDQQAVAESIRALGGLADYQSQWDDALNLFEQCLKLYQALGDQHGENLTLCNFGNVYKGLGDTQKAIDYYEKAITLARQIDNGRDESRALGNLGSVYLNLSEYDKALATYRQTLILKQRVGDRRGESIVLGNIGVVYRATGELAKSITYYERALALKRQIGERMGEGIVLGNIANTYQDMVQIDKAISYLQQAYAISHTIHDRLGDCVNLGNIGDCYHDLGEIDKAQQYYEKAITLSRELKDRRMESFFLSRQAKAYLDMGCYEDARTRLNEALDMARQVRSQQNEGYILTFLATLHLVTREFSEGAILGEQALNLADKINSPDLMVSSRTALAKIRFLQNQYEHSLEILETARTHNILTQQHRVHALRGVILMASKRFPEAKKAFSESIQLANDLLQRTTNYYPARVSRYIVQSARNLTGEATPLLDSPNTKWLHDGTQAEVELLLSSVGTS